MSTEEATGRTPLELANAAFNALPPAERRVKIAEDAIVQLEAGRYRATLGTQYFYGNGETIGDVQEYLASGKECTVCAMGGLLASRARLGDSVSSDRSSLDGDEVVDALEGEFSEDMLRMIESLYEGFRGDLLDLAKDLTLEECLTFPWWVPGVYRKSARRAALRRREQAIETHGVVAVGDALVCLPARERMIYLMRNIVHNYGSLVFGGARYDG